MPSCAVYHPGLVSLLTTVLYFSKSIRSSNVASVNLLLVMLLADIAVCGSPFSTT